MSTHNTHCSKFCVIATIQKDKMTDWTFPSPTTHDIIIRFQTPP